jgi:hypothetical protein
MDTKKNNRGGAEAQRRKNAKPVRAGDIMAAETFMWDAFYQARAAESRAKSAMASARLAINTVRALRRRMRTSALCASASLR